jgi:anti-sigma28 factor (negative regulator of flagellin synthesis)
MEHRPFTHRTRLERRTPFAPVKMLVPRTRPAPFATNYKFSEAGQLAERMSEIPDIRWDKVNSIRAALAQGTYETDAKMSAALDNLLDEIG